jgi:hypothetical protein
MGDIEDYDFSTGDAGASHIFNSEAGQVRVGGLDFRLQINFLFYFTHVFVDTCASRNTLAR